MAQRKNTQEQRFGETERSPTKLLSDLVAALGLTTDALIGVAPKG